MMADGVLLLLGSNVGRRVRSIREAVESLKSAVDVRKLSRIYAGAPWGRPGQPWFLNMAVSGVCSLSPPELLRFVKGVEAAAGRRTAGRLGPRTLDIDILLMGETVYDDPHLRIPHASMAFRRFCLLPAAEIAPEAVVPPGNRTVSELLEMCTDTNEVIPI